jgi:hypothetical protein
METWYAFRAYNAQTHYGYGTAQEAERYADKLNAGREINHFAAHTMIADEISDLKLENNDLGFSLAIALSDQRGLT